MQHFLKFELLLLYLEQEFIKLSCCNNNNWIMEENDIKYNEKKVKQLNKYQDIVDVFVNIILLRLPTVYVLINMILMIWLVRTIYSSLNNNSVPKSLYQFAPFLSARPVTALYFSFEPKCSSGFEQAVLKTLPSITNLNLKKSSLTKWVQESIVCIKKSEKDGNFSIKCEQNSTYCSGLCVKDKQECPITSIRKINTNQNIMINDIVLFYTPDSLYKYVASRDSKNNFVVGLLSQFQSRCVNQYYYYDTFSTFQEYWGATKICGKEGTLTSQMYLAFDRIKVTDFFQSNAILHDKINEVVQNQRIDLGYVKSFKYSQSLQCSHASQIASQLSKKLSQGPIQSLYSKNMLIIAFVLFTLSWVWLIIAYCFDGWLIIKNIFIILLAAIEFITLTFIYNQNLKIVDVQNMITIVSNCIDEQQSQLFKNWQFGVEDRSPFLCILFASAAFLLLEILSFFISSCVYVPYYVQSQIMDEQLNCMRLSAQQK